MRSQYRALHYSASRGKNDKQTNKQDQTIHQNVYGCGKKSPVSFQIFGEFTVLLEINGKISIMFFSVTNPFVKYTEGCLFATYFVLCYMPLYSTPACRYNTILFYNPPGTLMPGWTWHASMIYCRPLRETIIQLIGECHMQFRFISYQPGYLQSYTFLQLLRLQSVISYHYACDSDSDIRLYIWMLQLLLSILNMSPQPFQLTK